MTMNANAPFNPAPSPDADTAANAVGRDLADPFGRTREPPPVPLSPFDPRARLVADVVAFAAGSTGDEIMARTRCGRGLTTLRHVAMYLFSSVFGASAALTAQAFKRDRTTVQYALRKIEDGRERPAFDRWIAALEAALAATPERGDR
jgi:hypothetical protein